MDSQRFSLSKHGLLDSCPPTMDPVDLQMRTLSHMQRYIELCSLPPSSNHGHPWFLWMVFHNIGVKSTFVSENKCKPTITASMISNCLWCQCNLAFIVYVFFCKHAYTQQKSYSIRHLRRCTVTTPRLESDRVVTVLNCRQYGDCMIDQLRKSPFASICQRWLYCHCPVTMYW